MADLHRDGDIGDDILIEPDGGVRFVYSDTLAEVFDGDAQETRRASHVEPATSIGWDADGWIADMRPSGGPLLVADVIGGVKQPFRTRQAALDAERVWLRKEQGL